jgi:Isochorismatase family
MRRHSPRRQKRRFSERIARKNMEDLKYYKEITALLVIDPYNDFISERGKVWDRLKDVAEANKCVPHMMQVLDAARKADIRVFYALHRRYQPGDYETWKYIAPIQKAAWSRKTFEYRTWGGEIRSEFAPQPGDPVIIPYVGATARRAFFQVKRSAMPSLRRSLSTLSPSWMLVKSRSRSSLVLIGERGRPTSLQRFGRSAARPWFP